MIKHIKLQGVATYTEPVDIDFKDINFIYGGNGTGKTTLSKVISGEIQGEQCTVQTDGASNETILVYNKSFVEKNFREVGDIAGIFTLGMDSGDILALIKDKESSLNNLHAELDAKRKTISAKKQELSKLRERFDDDCWPIQVRFGKDFPKAMTGTRGAKQQFSQKCLDFFASLEKSSISKKPADELKALYHAAYSGEASTYPLFPEVDLKEVTSLDQNSLLSKRVTGKADSDIGRFIEYLGSSDWIKQGIGFAEKAKGKCPYCSQALPQNIREDIEAFFDETYQRECQQLNEFSQHYTSLHTRILRQLKDIVDNPCPILSYTELEPKLVAYQALLERNTLTIQQKLTEPSLIIHIDSCFDLLSEINAIIIQLNTKISENNRLVDNLKDTQRACDHEVWRAIVAELTDTIQRYIKDKAGVEKAIANISDQGRRMEQQIQELTDEIREKKSSISTVEYTVQAINHILEGYGFNGFLLSENTSVPGTYQIIRPDGTDAKASLSEGEYNFITFLYFYHLIFGSSAPGQVDSNKIIVIDDPISSLDSNVLFIVSSLVRNIIAFCRQGENSVKQVIISTHNIYFHKEITFVGDRDHWPKTRTSFFIIKKQNEISRVAVYTDNPIQSSYEMLWDDIRTPENTSAKSLFNTMRRILENYFKIIGGIDYEKCINEFEGEDRLICKSLISCINEQSHTISDDFYMCIEDSELNHYLTVFRGIFDKMDQISHYNMMMHLTE